MSELLQLDATGLTPAWTEFRPHAKQIAAFASTKRFVGITAGRGSGKTELLRRKLVLALADRKPWPDPRYFYAADTLSHTREIAWQAILDLIPKSWLAGSPRESLDSLEIKTVFGSSLRLFGLLKGQRGGLPVEGKQWDGGGIDESCDCPPGVFDRSIIPALTWRNGWCWRIGVPKRHGIGAVEFRQWWEQAYSRQMKEAAAFTWPSSDILPAPALEYARNHLDPKDWREQFEASWETPGGGVFWAFDPQQNVRPCTYYANLPLAIGCDFNVDPMCWCIGHRYGDRMEWFDEIFIRDTNTQATMDALWARYSSHTGGFEFFCDASGGARKTSAQFTDLAIIQNDRRFAEAPGERHVYIPEGGNPPVADRFAACNAMFLNAAGERRMFIAPNCKNLLEDVSARHYKPGTSNVADTGDLGHMTDGMGYLVYQCYPLPLKLDQDVPEVILTKGPMHLRV